MPSVISRPCADQYYNSIHFEVWKLQTYPRAAHEHRISMSRGAFTCRSSLRQRIRIYQTLRAAAERHIPFFIAIKDLSRHRLLLESLYELASRSSPHSCPEIHPATLSWACAAQAPAFRGQNGPSSGIQVNLSRSSKDYEAPQRPGRHS